MIKFHCIVRKMEIENNSDAQSITLGMRIPVNNEPYFYGVLNFRSTSPFTIGQEVTVEIKPKEETEKQ